MLHNVANNIAAHIEAGSNGNNPMNENKNTNYNQAKAAP